MSRPRRHSGALRSDVQAFRKYRNASRNEVGGFSAASISLAAQFRLGRLSEVPTAVARRPRFSPSCERCIFPISGHGTKMIAIEWPRFGPRPELML